MKKPVTIKEIAKKLDLSFSTVSRALHGHPSISLLTQQRVKQTADQMGYEPNQTAIFFQKGKTFTIGVILPELAEAFFAVAISAIEDIAYKKNYTVLLAQSHDDEEREKLLVDKLKAHRIDGLLVSVAKDTSNFEHFEQLKKLLDALHIEYQVNPCLVRGLDYYNKTVFEWVTYQLGTQGTVCAGGRYDGLVEQLGGKATPALGFALGIERLILLIQSLNIVPGLPGPIAYLITDSAETYAKGLALACQMREEYPSVRIVQHCGGGSMKSQFKKADKSGARFALILGQAELEADMITIKALRSEGEQESLPLGSVGSFLNNALNA